MYKGFTNDINKRIKEHNGGKNYSTKIGRPWKLVYCEIFLNKYDAINREKFFKTGWGRKHLKKVLKNYLKSK